VEKRKNGPGPDRDARKTDACPARSPAKSIPNTWHKTCSRTLYKNAMSKSLFVTIACVLPCLVLSAFPLSQPLHYRIASDPALKGKGKDGQCMDYAIALSSRLASNGIHGQLIFYRWHIQNTPTNGSHVFVTYRLSDGTKWIVDNEIPHPKAVPVDASPMQLVYLLSGSESAPVEVKLQEGLNQLGFF
jgi:hypothetical protein